jgi:putative membrane protein
MNKKKTSHNWNRERGNWFKILTNLRCSVIPAILPRVLLCSFFSCFVVILYLNQINVAIPTLGTIVPSVVLGLILVFRTNTAYDRFWEGRQLWGTLVNRVRNFARLIWVSVGERDSEDREHKIKILRLLIAFAIATKLHLRGEPVNSELEVLMPKGWYEKLKEMNNPPLEIAFWIGDYLQHQHQLDLIDTFRLNAMFQLLDSMVDVLGGCERILKTPIPLAYSIHLKQLLLVYCLSLPFQIVKDLTWWTIPIVSLISFAVFGIEEIGIQIENPFGYYANDLPLDKICQTMLTNIEDLISLAPCVRTWRTKHLV